MTELQFDDRSRKNYPLELHFIKHLSDHYVFDVRNFAILKLDAIGSAVLSMIIGDHPLKRIIEELKQFEIPESVIKNNYLKFLKYISDGTLSTSPIQPTCCPKFNRLVIMLSGGCNMGCLYCFEKNVPMYKSFDLMTLEMSEKVLAWFFRHQEGEEAYIQLYGGEPLLNWPVLVHVAHQAEILAKAKAITLVKHLITNGTLLNESRVSWLKEHNVSVQVSVDGDAKTHDRFRRYKSGRPTYHLIKPKVLQLDQQGVNFNLRAVLTKANKDPSSVLTSLKTLRTDRVSFEIVATDFPDAMFTEMDWMEFNRAYSEFISSSFSGWSNMPEEMQSMVSRICKQQRFFFGCGGGLNEVTVAPNGDIYECQRMYKKPIANISEDLSPCEASNHFQISVDERSICKDCWARYLCGGGCLHQTEMLTGSTRPYPQFCAMKQNLAEASIIKICEIRAQNMFESGLE